MSSVIFTLPRGPPSALPPPDLQIVQKSLPVGTSGFLCSASEKDSQGLLPPTLAEQKSGGSHSKPQLLKACKSRDTNTPQEATQVPWVNPRETTLNDAPPRSHRSLQYTTLLQRQTKVKVKSVDSGQTL